MKPKNEDYIIVDCNFHCVNSLTLNGDNSGRVVGVTPKYYGVTAALSPMNYQFKVILNKTSILRADVVVKPIEPSVL